MKILMVNKFLFKKGGSETYMMELGKALTSLGNEVEYFGMYDEKNCVFNSENAYTSNMDFHSGNPIKKIAYSLKTITSTEARKKIRAILNSFSPDVVHLNNFNFQLTPSIILEIRDYEKTISKKIKIIYTAHDYQLICPNHMMIKSNGTNCFDCINGNFKCAIKNSCIHQSKLKSIIGAIEGYYWKNKNVYNELDTIICPTKFMKEKLDSNPVFKDKTKVLINFSNITFEKDVKKEKYALYFGRYSKEKGIDDIISVIKQFPDNQFVFAGDGEYNEIINAQPNIKNLGFLSGDALYECIKSARFSIYTPIWYENCPFSVIESISLGTPVLATNIGGIPELITDKENGIIVKPSNKNEMKQAMNDLFNKDELVTHLSKNCTKDKFLSVTEYASSILKYYN